MSTQLDPLTISADLLYAVKTGGDCDELRDRLATLERDRLRRVLSGRPRKLSFWLNCYNAYAQLLLEADPSLLGGGVRSRLRFRAGDRIPVAGVWLSLNDIEHGILRRSKHPWGLGYVPRPFPSSFEYEFRLDRADPRIHFALGRGTEGDPPVTVFSPRDCDEELDVATEWFLEENVSYDAGADAVRLPRLFLRYRGDFGGTNGIRDFLRRYDAVPSDAQPALEYEGDRSIDLDDDRR